MAGIPKQSLFTATVIEVIADAGGAVVMPNVSAPNKQTQLIVASLPYCDAASGALPYHMYPAGSTVLCSWRRDGSEDICYIVGGLNVGLDPRIWGYKSHKAYNAEKFTQAMSDVLSDWKLLERLCPDGKHTWLRDRSHGASGDAIGGDYDIQDRTGFGGLHIGRLLAQLKGSAMAFIDASVTDSKLRRVGDVLEDHTLATETVSGGLYTVRNTAVSIPESFGLREGRVMKMDDRSPVLQDEDAIPLYRMQHMSGALLDGSEDIVVGFSTDASQKTHDSEHEPPVLAKRRMALSGELTDASAYGVSSIKSPFFYSAMQLGYGKKPKDGDKFDDLREPYDEPLTESKAFKEQEEKRAAAAAKDDRRDVSDAAINKLIDTLLEGDYRDALLKIMAEKGFTKSNEKASVYEAIKNKTVIGGPREGAEYELPESITLKDPVTGEEKTYFASMSFITQEPDGSICICDGYGSEIRMCRGNIYISPALDCFVRPGRDLSVMAGRHQSYNSQKTFTISTSGSGYIQTQNDLRVGGAQSGDGLVVLESGNTLNQEDKGLVIRSMGSGSFTVTNHLYLGRNRHALENEGTDDPEDRGGSVIIDAGLAGNIYTKCSTSTIDVQQFTVCASNAGDNGGTGCAFTIDRNSLHIWANMRVTGDFALSDESPITTMTVNRSGKEVAVRMSDNPCQLTVNGAVAIATSLTVGTDILVHRTMLAKTVMGDGEYNNIGGRPNQAKDMLDKPLELETPKGQDIAYTSLGFMVAGSIYSNYYVTANAFSFPETYDVVCPLMPGMVWQQRCPDSGAKWDEKYLKETACYPGLDVWKNQRITVTGYGDPKAVIGGYAINI